LLVLATALAAGCAETAGPSARNASPGAAFDFADNPSTPSVIIIRRDSIPVRVITLDVAQGLMAIHGPVDNPICSNATTKDFVDGQRINTPSDVQGFRLLLQATDTHVEVYESTDLSAVFPFVASKFCAFVANTPKAYEGSVAYHVNLGSSMASFRWEGDVTRPADGASFHYLDNQDAVFTPNGNSPGSPSFIRVTPIGR
jgi:hypothetical protein